MAGHRLTDVVACVDFRVQFAAWTRCHCFIMAALCNRAGHYIFALWFLSSYFFLCSSFFLASSQRSEIGCLPYFHTWCGLSDNLECRSEMCCTRLTKNTGCKKSPSGNQRTTLSGYIFATKACIEQYGELRPTIVSFVWVTPANFNGFRVLAALLYGTPVLGISQTLRRWTEGATYIWQGGHHVGHWPTFLVLTYYGRPME